LGEQGVRAREGTSVSAFHPGPRAPSLVHGAEGDDSSAFPYIDSLQNSASKACQSKESS